MQSTLQCFLGALTGLPFQFRLETVALAPHNFRKHKYKLILLLVELAVAALAFAFVDEIVPETGFQSGVWLSFLWYTLWWGIVFFINFKYGAYEAKTANDRVLYCQTYIVWWTALLPYYVAASLPYISNYVAGIIGLVLSVSLALLAYLYGPRYISLNLSAHPSWQRV